MDYPIYPIYSRWVSVYEKIPDDKLEDEWFLKRQHPTERGFYKNHYMPFQQMFKEDPGCEFVLKELKKNWKPKGEILQGSEGFKVEKIDEEEWCLTWFSHYTFDIGQSDEEVLISFENFLRRKGLRLNYGYDPYYSVEADSKYHAMGAEDRWRWKGRSSSGEETNPPCRCSDCVKFGIIRIDH